MARFKPIHNGLKLLPVDFERQVIPGSFEYALCHLVDHELDLTPFHARYKNDDEGVPAFDPARGQKLERLQKEAQQLRDWLRIGVSASIACNMGLPAQLNLL